MTLFSNAKRTYMGPKPYAEPDYEYLDRSARSEAATIRGTLDEWFSRYPTSERKDLLGRFLSSHEIQHRGAAFELYLHELLVRLGFQVAVHPETPSQKNTRPDFLVARDGEGLFYLEAVQSLEISDEERAAAARVNVVYDTINALESHNFFVAVDYKHPPAKSPSGSKLRSKLGAWLQTLDPDAVAREADEYGPDALPFINYTDDDWEVTFTAMPRSPDKRDTPAGSVIGILGAQARWLSTWQAIRDSLLAKANRYGELDHPLVIAVDVISIHLDRTDEMEALLGQEQYVLQTENPTAQPRIERLPNGLWNGPAGPRYSRVAGVLIGYDVKPWTFGVRNLTTYVNPYIDSPDLGNLLTFPSAIAAAGTMQWNDGTHPAEILALPENYPGRAQG